jgi:hypothetical protein
MPPDAIPDRQRLADFLLILRDVLLRVLEYRQDLLPEHLWDPVQTAWPQANAAIAELQSDLTSPEDPIALDEQLNRVGLAGASLDYKLAGFNAVIGPVRPPQGKQHAGWFARVFEWSNVILGSLSEVLPDAEVLKGFKEAAEQGLKDVG